MRLPLIVAVARVMPPFIALTLALAIGVGIGQHFGRVEVEVPVCQPPTKLDYRGVWIGITPDGDYAVLLDLFVNETCASGGLTWQPLNEAPADAEQPENKFTVEQL